MNTTWLEPCSDGVLAINIMIPVLAGKDSLPWLVPDRHLGRTPVP